VRCVVIPCGAVRLPVAWGRDLSDHHPKIRRIREGNDTISGSAGNDLVIGGRGNDVAMAPATIRLSGTRAMAATPSMVKAASIRSSSTVPT
jgi:hypothetical protein